MAHVTKAALAMIAVVALSVPAIGCDKRSDPRQFHDQLTTKPGPGGVGENEGPTLGKGNLEKPNDVADQSLTDPTKPVGPPEPPQSIGGGPAADGGTPGDDPTTWPVEGKEKNEKKDGGAK